MALYTVAARTSNVTVNQAACELYTTADVPAKIWEIGFAQLAAAVGVYGIGRPRAQGVVPATTSGVQAEQSTADRAGATTLALTWTTSPTEPAVYFRRFNTALATSGAIFTFPRGLVIPVSSSLVIWNVIAGSAADVWFVLDE